MATAVILRIFAKSPSFAAIFSQWKKHALTRASALVTERSAWFQQMLVYMNELLPAHQLQQDRNAAAGGCLDQAF